MATIYISSTYLDLKEHRQQVEHAIMRMGHTYNAMELYVAEDRLPVAKCLDDVSKCDIYLGIYAWRYGWIPGDNNPEDYSITEMEYRQAEKTNKDCLIFLLNDGVPWPRKDIDRDATKIEKLRNTASARHTADYFTTPDDLVSRVLQAINKWDLEHRVSLSIPTSTPSYKIRLLDAVPEVTHFIGREKELNEYRQQLVTDNIVVIEGMAGVGKTTLGAKLAREQLAQGRQVFWITFDTISKNNAEELVWDLAKFLDDTGYAELGKFLERETSNARKPDLSARFGLILAGLKRGHFTLCLDDLQVVLKDPTIQHFFNELQKRFQNRNSEIPFQLIIMTRETPSFMRNLFREPLRGFTAQDAQDFLAIHNIKLGEARFKLLYTQVDGNPQFLRLSLAGLRAHQENSTALTNFIQGLEGQPSVRDYLMEKVYGTLSTDSQRIFDVLAIFPALVPRDTVSVILVGDAVRVSQSIDELVLRNEILETQDTHWIGLHSLVRDYCYRNLDADQKQRLHFKAATHFAEQHDWIAGAYHYHHAKKYDSAAEAIVSHAVELMNSGRLDSMLEQLSTLPREKLTHKNWTAVCQVRGDSLLRCGEYDNAIAAYQSALDTAIDLNTQANLYHCLGDCYERKGSLDQAIHNYTKQKEICKIQNDSTGMATAYLGLGLARYHLGDYATAFDEFSQAVQISEKTGDALSAARGYANLGMVFRARGNLESAMENSRMSLQAFRQANQQDSVASILMRLAHIHVHRGEYAQAILHLSEAIEIFKTQNDRYGNCVALNNLGELYREQGNVSQAMEYLEQSALGNRIQAQEEFDMAYNILKQVGNKPYLADLDRSYGIFLMGDPHRQKEGCGYLQNAIELYNLLGARKEAEKLSKLLNT